MKPQSDMLDLVMEFRWYDLIAEGKKDVEYRARTPHWIKRIGMRDGIKRVCFRRGYTNTTMIRDVAAITLGSCPYEGFGAAVYYQIHLTPSRASDG